MAEKKAAKIELAEYAGYCYGVERALKLASRAISESVKPIYTLGPIIHNPQVVDKFMKDGVVPVDEIAEVDSGTVIIRTHGVDPGVIGSCNEKGLHVVDATCPFVAKAQNCAESLIDSGYQVIIVGERDHPEVAGILAHTGGQAIVVEDPDDLSDIDLEKKVGIVVQTTQSLEKLREILVELSSLSSDLKVFNTICNATAKRQQAAKELADRADIMLVVGGKNSANTGRLAKICEAAGAATYHIETAAEIDTAWFAGAEIIGITAGASTPEWLLNEVADKVNELIRT